MGTMNVKGGVNAFGKTVGETKSTNDQVKNLSAADLEKLGGEDVGAVLNKVADPNWIDPSKKMRAVGNNQLDKDAFFKLMLAQMKNQDPTNPMKSHEMAAQLANFSSLEQMQNINTTLTEMKNAGKPAEQFQALSLIGRSVAGDSTELIRTKDDKEHDFKFDLPTDADVTVKVRNQDGQIVRSYDLKNLKMGDNKITWNGQDDNGRTMPAGNYQFMAEAKNKQGQKLAVKTAFDGVITGVNFTPEGPVLMVGKQTVRLRDVRKITDPKLGASQNDQKLENPSPADLKSTEGSVQNKEMIQGSAVGMQNPASVIQGLVEPEAPAPGVTSGAAPTVAESKTSASKVKPALTESKGAPAAQPSKLGQIMGQVGMSSEMMSKVAKEAKETN